VGIKQRCEEEADLAQSEKRYMLEHKGLYLFRKQEAQGRRASVAAAAAEYWEEVPQDRRTLYLQLLASGDSQMQAALALSQEADALAAEGEVKWAEAVGFHEADPPDYYPAMDAYQAAGSKWNAAREKYAHARQVTDSAFGAYKLAFDQILPPNP